MDSDALGALKETIRPVPVGRALTLSEAARASKLNAEVARFYAALAMARRILDLAGVIDERLELELLRRAEQLGRALDAEGGGGEERA